MRKSIIIRSFSKHDDTHKMQALILNSSEMVFDQKQSKLKGEA